MSKIINKKQLDFLIESTMKEAGMTESYYNPWGSEEPSRNDDPYYTLKDASERAHAITKNRKENGEEAVRGTGEPGKSNEEPKSESYMKDGMCECGGMMYEGTCNECGSSYMEEGDWMKEDELEEGNAFSGALEKARKEGKKEFEFDGKIYPVEGGDKVEESVKDLAESVTKTFNPSFLTEDMDNFKKLINYRNK